VCSHVVLAKSASRLISIETHVLKTFNIEMQRIKAMSHGNGLVNAQIDAFITPTNTALAEGKTPTTWLSMTEDNARVLQQLLKAQLAEIDKRKARSQR
jgi:hypothetical protein